MQENKIRTSALVIKLMALLAMFCIVWAYILTSTSLTLAVLFLALTGVAAILYRAKHIKRCLYNLNGQIIRLEIDAMDSNEIRDWLKTLPAPNFIRNTILQQFDVTKETEVTFKEISELGTKLYTLKQQMAFKLLELNEEVIESSGQIHNIQGLIAIEQERIIPRAKEISIISTEIKEACVKIHKINTVTNRLYADLAENTDRLCKKIIQLGDTTYQSASIKAWMAQYQFALNTNNEKH